MAYPADEFIIRPKQGGAEAKPGLNLAKNKEKMVDISKTASAESSDVSKIIWLSVSEVAKLGGLSTKTVRRAIESGQIKFKVINNRYQINMTTAIKFFLSSQKLKNKLNSEGIGQWVDAWK